MTVKRIAIFIVIVLFAIEGGGKIYDFNKGYLKQNEVAESLLKGDIFVSHGISYSVIKSSDVYRVIVLGGSAAEGFGRIIQEKYNKSKPLRWKKLEVINFARGANTTIDDYVNMIQKGLALQPDKVVLYSGWNDIAVARANCFYRNVPQAKRFLCYRGVFRLALDQFLRCGGLYRGCALDVDAARVSVRC